MSTVLVTGATGLVGSHVTRLLVERGDRVRVTVRGRSRMDNLAGLAVEQVPCDLLDARAVRRALTGVDRVFHVAGLTSLRASRQAHTRANVQATRTLLQEALRAGVQRVVHTSSAAALGPAPRGSTADERQPFSAGGIDVPYLHAKREAESEAMDAVAHGLPVVVVSPTHVFGAGDLYRSSTVLVLRFLRRQIPAYVDGALNVVDAEDVARGHLLADERGVPGERYVLGNRNFTLDRLFADLGRISGVAPPALKLPYHGALAVARAAEALPGTPAITQVEVRAAAQWWAFRSTKAKRELGWVPSHHEDTLERTVAWYRDRGVSGLARAGTSQPLPLRVAGFAMRRADAVADRLTP